MAVPRWLVLGSYLAAVLACGSRTGLFAGGSDGSGGSDPFVEGDGGVAPPLDAAPPVDGRSQRDSPAVDALPPIDVLPAPDAALRPPPNNCPDAAATLIYLISEDRALLSFDPRSAAFSTIGTINCPITNTDPRVSDTPNSMAVDHLGTAYVGFQQGEIFRVSTATGSCRPTGFQPGQQGFPPTFGMGFVADGDGGETLYVAGMENGSRLATIDTKTFALSVVGPFVPAVVSQPELTGTGGGDLFAFYQGPTNGNDSAIGQIDRATARVVAQSTLTGVAQGHGWAFAFWGGDFYTFTAPGPDAGVPGTVVHRFRPSDGSVVTVTQYPQIIVGAGVSTCAPQQ